MVPPMKIITYQLPFKGRVSSPASNGNGLLVENDAKFVVTNVVSSAPLGGLQTIDSSTMGHHVLVTRGEKVVRSNGKHYFQYASVELTAVKGSQAVGLSDIWMKPDTLDQVLCPGYVRAANNDSVANILNNFTNGLVNRNDATDFATLTGATVRYAALGILALYFVARTGITKLPIIGKLVTRTASAIGVSPAVKAEPTMKPQREKPRNGIVFNIEG